MKHLITIIILLSLLGNFSICHAQQSLDQFNAAMRVLVLKYFPKASFTTTDTTLSAKFNVKDFWILAQTKVGHTKDTVKTRGPNRGGIYCTIELGKGRPAPRAAVALWNGEKLPRYYNKYFYESFLFPYSEKNNCYLYVVLKFSKGTSEKFLSDFETLVNSFEKYL